jgi:hypothetical protein
MLYWYLSNRLIVKDAIICEADFAAHRLNVHMLSRPPTSTTEIGTFLHLY